MPTETPPSLEFRETGHQLQPEQWLDRYGDALYVYAWARLRDRSMAEDLVQQTFLEALKSRSRFKGASSEKNWLFTILKHNLIDFLRRKSAVSPIPDEMDPAEALPDPFETDGWDRGTWKTGFEPVDFRSPETELAQSEFWKTFHRCVSKLPAHIARVVLLREMEDLSTEEICSIAGISQNHFWVLRHRARIALQHCLKKEWFQ